MSTFDELFGAKSLGGETGGATLDLLKQIQAAAQSGISVGMEKKEQHLGNFLKASQDIFTTRYSKEEPMIDENGKKRPLNDKELLGSALGIPPKGLVWEKRTDFIPGIKYDTETGEYTPTGEGVPRGATSLLSIAPRRKVAQEKMAWLKKKFSSNILQKAFDYTNEYHYMNLPPIPDTEQYAKYLEEVGDYAEMLKSGKTEEMLKKQEKLKKGKAPKEVVPY